MDECNICKECCNIPHWLPCHHRFCYKCIKRHINKRNFCPVCFKSPYTATDLKTEMSETTKLDKVPTLSLSDESKLRKELAKFRLDTSGDKTMLIHRYREFKLNVENERFRDIPRNYDTIVRHIHKEEIDGKKIDRKNREDKESIRAAILKLRKEIKKQE